MRPEPDAVPFGAFLSPLRVVNDVRWICELYVKNGQAHTYLEARQACGLLGIDKSCSARLSVLDMARLGLPFASSCVLRKRCSGE